MYRNLPQGKIHISMIAKELDTNVVTYKCILMYLDVSWCILMYMNGTHQDTPQDTS